jgi:hypothetical protein
MTVSSQYAPAEIPRAEFLDRVTAEVHRRLVGQDYVIERLLPPARAEEQWSTHQLALALAQEVPEAPHWRCRLLHADHLVGNLHGRIKLRYVHDDFQRNRAVNP